MRKRNAIMLALAATMTAVAVPAAAYYLTAPSDDEYAKTMRGLGFMPIPLPSDLITVGALYYVDPSARYFRTACALESGDLDGVLKKYRATQVSGDALRKGRFSTNFRVDVGAALGGDGGASYEQRVHYSLTDVFVEEISLSHNRTIREKLMATESCNQEVLDGFRNGGYICQGQQALQATAEFKLDRDTERKVAATGKATPDAVRDQVKRAIEAQGETNVVEREGRLFAGAALKYGVSMNPTCLAPMTSRYPRILPRSGWDRFVNFVKFNVLEPILPAGES
jgi:hypothetical protein